MRARTFGLLLTLLILPTLARSTAAGGSAVDRTGPTSAFASLGVPENARAEGAMDGQEPRVLARLVLHPDAGRAAGELRVGVLLEMDPGWHVYGQEPGDVGLPTAISWQAENAAVSSLPWPEAQRFEELDGELVSWGYEGRVLLPAVLHFPPGERPTRLRAEVQLLACQVECIPGSFQLERNTRLTAAEIAAEPQLQAVFAQAFGDDSLRPAGRTDAAAMGPGVWRAIGLGLLGGLLAIHRWPHCPA